MRTVPEALKAHLAGDATTVCHAWRVTRRDGAVLGFTDHDHTLDSTARASWLRAASRPANGKRAAGFPRLRAR